MPSYSDLLKDPRWQRRRLRVLEAAHWKCASCGNAERTLNVHHRCYRRGAKPWDYTDDELVVLCEDCHLARHQLEAELQQLISHLDTAELERVIAYVSALAILVDAHRVKIDVTNPMCRNGILDAVSGRMEGWTVFEQTLLLLKEEDRWLPADQVQTLADVLSNCEINRDVA